MDPRSPTPDPPGSNEQLRRRTLRRREAGPSHDDVAVRVRTFSFTHSGAYFQLLHDVWVAVCGLPNWP